MANATYCRDNRGVIIIDPEVHDAISVRIGVEKHIARTQIRRKRIANTSWIYHANSIHRHIERTVRVPDAKKIGVAPLHQ